MNTTQEKNSYTSAEDYLDLVCQSLPVINQAINSYGDDPLAVYLKNAIPEAAPAYQQRDDLLGVVSRYAGSLLGKSVAQRVVHDLAISPVVLTANHHGVDYFSQSVQGSLIFALNVIQGPSALTTVPIFSFGNVPLNNLTYPRGILLYHLNQNRLQELPQKLPLFPEKFKRSLVSVVSAFDQTMLNKTHAQVDKMFREKLISPALTRTIQTLLQEDYSAAEVLSLTSYSRQAVVLNSRIWKKLFSGFDRVPDLVYLEAEKIVSMLLESDLATPQSLAWSIMFDPALRRKILSTLDGIRGCWERAKLIQRVTPNSLTKVSNTLPDDCGTFFFWGIDSKKRKIPLFLKTDTSDNEFLYGVDNRGNPWELPYTSQAIIRGLHEQKLLPSLFTCFLTLAFARGLVCVGAYFQGEYLPEIQHGIVAALQETAGYYDRAHFVAQVPTSSYLPGMLAVMTRTKDGYLIPAGPIEIIAGGGLNNADIQQMCALSVREAHLAALFETLPAIVPPRSLPPSWRKYLAEDCSRLLQGKVVVK